MLKSNLIQIISLVLAALFFFLAVFFGYNTGKSIASSSQIYQNANQLTRGLEYFKQDQDRYPTEFEYANHDLMSVYFSVFPPADITSSNCPTNFLYKTSDPTSYILNFCLAHSVGNFVSGWNKVSPVPTLQ